VDDLILNHASVRAIFVNTPLTTEIFVKHVSFSYTHQEDLVTGMLELASKEHFLSF
jgi:hypothetical protein